MADKEVKLNLAQLTRIFYQLTTGQKIALGFITLAIFFSLIGVVLVATDKAYQPLFVNLNQQDAFDITQELKKKKIDYKYEPEDGIIRVPENKVNELRLYFASKGQPKSGTIGFELFDKKSFGMTDFVQKVNFRRALEGELASTIMSLDMVDAASVHITPAKSSPFAEEETPAKASVFLKLNSSKRLSEEQVNSIMNIVASGVEGLQPRFVVVVDQYGRTLSQNEDENSMTGITNAQLRVKKAVEKDLNQKIISLLEPIVGIGRVRSNISATLDFNKVKAISLTYDSEAEPVIRSQKETIEIVESGNPASGVPGTTTNIPGGTNTATTGSTGKKSSRTDKMTNYEVSKITKEVINSTGAIKKLSVSVLLDNKIVEKEKDGKWVTETVPLTDEELAKINEQVAAAVGIEKGRGDVVSVVNMPFTPTITKEELDQMASEKMWNRIFKLSTPLISLLFFVVLLLFVIKPIVRTVITPVLESFKPALEEKPKETIKKLPPKTVAELEAEIEAEIDSEFVPGIEVKRIEIIRERVLEAVKNDPEQAAGFFRSMLIEEEN
jgi:flagellar M-ring protein FliF